MTCPLCHGSGKILVINLDHVTRAGRDEIRPCPMKCVPVASSARSGDSVLEGNELTFDYGRKRKRHIRAGHKKRALNYYLGHEAKNDKS